MPGWEAARPSIVPQRGGAGLPQKAQSLMNGLTIEEANRKAVQILKDAR